MKANKIVKVRWFDGMMEDFTCTEVRPGKDHLWMKLESGENRWLPTKEIRWFSID
jgi:hypothetical protein